jgi:hypothetical protein
MGVRPKDWKAETGSHNLKLGFHNQNRHKAQIELPDFA